ncbi:MAG TPA: 50S ribosomal protein L23 [Phycisphaerales bacterium]|nr:50S ribosomal protein L23 [Phycisphaerales bacterium]HMP36439.1 50S ribosomal protein L23 [Phycisphaerales bacterium]
MLATDVIKRPIITEKATHASSELGQYVFEVDRRATKLDIRNAIEELYKVGVVAVNTRNRKGRFRRYRYGLVQLPSVKHAMVRVKEGEKIELF